LLVTANFGSYSITSNGWRYDVFVAKTDANGTWQWATDAGSSENDYAKSIALDGAGLPYVIGYLSLQLSLGICMLPAMEIMTFLSQSWIKWELAMGDTGWWPQCRLRV